MESLDELIRSLLETASRYAMEWFLRSSHQIKRDGSPVTAADEAIQKYLIKALTQHFPQDGIIAEENDIVRTPRQGSRYWTVDPIDGTVSFVAGIPSWAIALGLIEEGQPVAGFIRVPSTGDYFHSTGKTVFRGDVVRSLSERTSLDADMILLTHTRPHQHYTLAESFPGRIFSLGTASIHLSLVATGGADIVLIGRDKIWDLAPGYAMLRANGGVLRYLDGSDCDLSVLLDGRPAPLPMVGGPSVLVDQFFSHLDYWKIPAGQV
ncbi:MAG: inositol monophosphatase family protein [Rhodothermaceae bacterium]|nr:inositol monophosphatase family protein [Rhodothermaceae bacterium]MYF39486.1 inositol monophosphatase family protein [Rhodothermaceae bacterium]MYH07615.1 inositol monophosphatase family protein [Rhodothermaceae bacterium]